MLKCFGQEAKEQLAGLFSDIVAGADIPADWQRGRVALILKRGGKAGNLQDYRPLTVTSTMYRLFTQVLKGWISGWAEYKGQLTELQNGFRKGRRLEDNLFVLTQCVEIARKEGRTLLCCFMDVEKAYDNVPHDILFAQLAALGMPEKLLATVRRLYANNSIIAHFANVKSRPVGVCRGLRQGCPLSPILYLLYVSGMERALLESSLGFRLKYSTSGIDENRRLPGLAFADDVVLMAESKAELQALMCHRNDLARFTLQRQKDQGSAICWKHG